ncbi:hypothetical protein GHO39_27060 [Pseudomonas helleri]|uniref:50S ribosomal protein L31 n=1 Tax=Pseudomonas helleri TaxID=1608996 RepID=A0A7X2C6L2_9PSED|nr:hypothetical protein [Pseudomonas helleri]
MPAEFISYILPLTHADGDIYSHVKLDVSNAPHPVYTREKRKAKAESGIAYFYKRQASK